MDKKSLSEAQSLHSFEAKELERYSDRGCSVFEQSWRGTLRDEGCIWYRVVASAC
jgi:hypothetical protein